MEETQFDGLFFDGQHSQAQPVSLKIHQQQKKLYLKLEDGQVQQWDFADLALFDGPNHLEIRNSTASSAHLRLEVNAIQKRDIHRVLSKNNLHFQFRQLGLFRILLVAALLFSGLVAAYFWLLPPIAEKSVEWLPTSVDDQIGNAFFSAVVDPIAIDTKRSAALNSFAAELKLRNKRPLHFNVVRSEEVNAFALPNGEIVVYTGLLRQIKTPAQLVALLGHEVSHVNERHSMKLLSRNLAGYMIISLLVGDVSGITAVLTDNAQQLQQLSYSRSNEEQADELGMKILIANRQDPKGMLQLFEILKSEGLNGMPEFLSTHPLPSTRIEHIRKYKHANTFVPNPKLEMWFEVLR
jgi:predicted Zn-dependent protease